MTDDERVYEGSGNVFADLGLPNAEEEQAKTKLAYQIRQIIKREGWSQTQAAEVLKIDQPKVSALMRLRVHGFSSDRLIRYLNTLGQEVEIVVKPKAEDRKQAGLYVLIFDDEPLAGSTVKKAPRRQTSLE